MTRVRRLPLVFEAEQWFPEDGLPGVTYPGQLGRNYVWTAGTIETLEGPHIVSPGDWVVTGIDGEKWAVKPDIFWQTYERLEDEGC
jgi:hypothetical protein